MSERTVEDPGRTDSVAEEVEQLGEKQPDQASEDTAMDDADPVPEPAQQETGEQAPVEPIPDLAEPAGGEGAADPPTEPTQDSATSDPPGKDPVPSGKPTLDEVLGGLKEPKKFSVMTPEQPPSLPQTPVNPLSGPKLQTPSAEELARIKKYRLGDMSFAEWTMIMESNHLLYGFRPLLTESKEIALASLPAFQAPRNAADSKWPNPSNADKVRLVITETSSLVEESVVSQGFSSFEVSSKFGATLETFSVGAKVDVTDTSASSKTSAKSVESHSIVGDFWMPYAEVNLEISKLEITDKCKDLVRNIMKTKNVADLNKFYTDYGRVYPQRVLLGGRLSTRSSIETNKSADRQKQLDQFASSLQATINVPLVVSGSLTVSKEVQDRKEQDKSAASVKKVESWTSTGGDKQVITDTNKWRQSLEQIHNWRPIEFGNLEKMELIISRVDEFRDFPAIINDILRIVHAPIIRSISAAPYYTQESLNNPNHQRPFEKLSLYQGIDALTGQVKTSPFEQASVERERSYKFEEEHDWRIVHDTGTLANLFKDIQHLHSEKMHLALAPVYLSHVHVSPESAEHGLTIVLRWKSDGHRYYVPKPEDVKLLPAAANLFKKSRSEFAVTYGDYYTVNIERRSCLVAVWKISFGRFKQDMESFLKDLQAKFAANPSPEAGVGIIKEQLKKGDNPGRRKTQVFVYRSSPDDKSLVLDTETENLVLAGESIVEHLKGQRSDILTNFEIFPYSLAILGFKSRPAPEQDGFVSWARALENTYYAMNDTRKLAKTNPQRDQWGQQLRDQEKVLLESQRAVIAENSNAAKGVAQEVKQLRTAINAQVQNLQSLIGPMQEMLDLWVSKSRVDEQLSIASMDKQNIHYRVAYEAGESQYSPLFTHRAESGQSRKFGLSDPPSEIDETARTMLRKLIKKPKEPRVEYYDLKWFDGMTKTQYEWAIECPEPGYQLLAYEIINEYWNSSNGRFWLSYPVNGAYDGADTSDFLEPPPRVGKPDELLVFFERPEMKSFKIRVETWWVPQRIEESHFQQS